MKTNVYIIYIWNVKTRSSSSWTS